jgi:hypothetical protein
LTKAEQKRPPPKDELGKRAPLVYVEHAHVGVSWKDLIRGKMVASLRLENPKVTLLVPQAKPEKKAPAPAPDLSAQLQQALPLRVDSVQVLDGQIVLRVSDGSEHPPELWVHRLDVSAQNLTTRRELAGGRPTTVAVHGLAGRSGTLTAFVTADPLASPLSFSGRVSLEGLRATELYRFIEPKTQLQASEGTVSMFTTFVAKGGMITGGVKPVLENIAISPAEEGTWTAIKAWLADKAVDIASDRVPGRNAVATTIPIKGKLGAPDVQLWPAVFGVIRNAFVQGLSAGFANLPPSTSDSKQSLWEQAKSAVKKDSGPPKAQPATSEKP